MASIVNAASAASRVAAPSKATATSNTARASAFHGLRAHKASSVKASARSGALVVKASADSDAATFGRRDIAKGALAGLSAAAIAAMPAGPAKAEEVSKFWEIVDLPLEPGVILLDIAFVPDDPKHGFLLGTRQTILETFDGGKTWDFKSIPASSDEDVNYRF